jgi:hypothetical protein
LCNIKRTKKFASPVCLSPLSDFALGEVRYWKERYRDIHYENSPIGVLVGFLASYLDLKARAVKLTVEPSVQKLLGYARR